MNISHGRCLLQSLLDQIGWSQSELEKRSGVSQRMISNYASNKQQMTADVMNAISLALGCELDDLYEWDNRH